MEMFNNSTHSYSMLLTKMFDKATLQTGTYNVRHIATGQYVVLKDTKRRSTLIALQDSHFEHIAVSFCCCIVCSYMLTLPIVGSGKAEWIGKYV